MKDLSTPARVHIAATLVAGAGVLYWTLSHRGPSFSLGSAIAFGLLFLLAEAFPVMLPSGGGYSVSFVVALAAMVTIGPAGAAIAGAFGGLNLRFIRQHPNPIASRLFNASNFILCSGLAGIAYQAAGGPIGMPLLSDFEKALLPVVAATAVNFATNTSLLAMMLALVRTSGLHRGHPVRIWRQELASLLPGYFAFAFLGLLLGVLRLQVGHGAIIFLLVPLLVARHAFQASVKMQGAYDATVESLITAIEAKDRYTRDHAGRVARLTEMVAREYGLRGQKLRVIRLAALMHDVGKLGVPTKVLAKPGKLTAEEYDTMKIHPIRGHEIVTEIDFLAEARSGVRHHHERMDGGGYPDGLRGEEIPVMARIIMVCDAFDSMTSTRIYRPAKDNEGAIAELRRCAGTQFDPEALEALIRSVERHGWTGVPELAVLKQVEEKESGRADAASF